MAWDFARGLEERGIAKGDRGMLWGENSAEWVAAFFGCTLRGVVVVPMDEAASADFALRVYRQVKAKLIVTSGAHLENWPAELDSLLFDEVRGGEIRSSTTQVA